MTQSILMNLDRAAIRREPFPHVVIQEALPAPYYLELAQSFPSAEIVAGTNRLENNAAYRKMARDSLLDPEVPPIWKEFIAYHCSAEFFREVCDVWGEDIERHHASLERNFGRPLREFSVGMRSHGKAGERNNQSHDVMMDCQFSINSPVRERSSVRGPHLDSPFKMFAALLYFRHPDDRSVGGDLAFFRLRSGRYPKPKPGRIDPLQVEQIGAVRYRANTLVMFVNTPDSIHGVTSRSVTNVPRRYMNFLGECYRGRADDFFVAVNPNLPYVLRKFLRHLHKLL